MPSRQPLHFTDDSFSSSSSVSAYSAHDSSPPNSAKNHRHSTAPPHKVHDHWFSLKIGLKLGGGISALLFAIIILLWVFKRRQKQCKASAQGPKSSIKLHKFQYGELKAATGCFSSEHKLGQGGFGVVYKGVLKNGQEIAVKRLDTTSFQGEREFQNELSVIGHVSASPHIVGLVGFCSHGKKRLLVYEYMHNRSLQEALFDDDYPLELDWKRRFQIILDTSEALAFLHTCEPAIIHGDIKPSNVLLDYKFCARIADFGLARFKMESGSEPSEEVEERQYGERRTARSQRRSVEKEKKHRKESSAVAQRSRTQQQQDMQTLPAETEDKTIRQSTSSKESPSVFTTSPDSDASSSFVGKQVCELSVQDGDVSAVQNDALLSDSDLVAGGSPLPEAYNELKPVEDTQAHASLECLIFEPVQRNSDLELEADDKASHSEGCFEKLSTDSGKELKFVGTKCKEKRKSNFGKDWWWRQESSGELNVKDYVMEWMGHENRREKGVSKECSLREDQSGEDGICKDSSRRSRDAWRDRRDHSRSSEWWGSILQEEGNGHASADAAVHLDKKKGEKSRGRDGLQWWKEDCCSTEASIKVNEIKKKDSLRASWRSASLEWWRDDSIEEGSLKSKKSCQKERSKSREWWKDDELANSKEWKTSKKKREHTLSREWWSGELLSRGVSSTPSMRGTICYVAPENGGGGVMSEKSDVYSFGVLLLVIISGRRPLQVMASPITEFERANLISWARLLAHSGNVLELVDSALNGEFSREQATLSITVALLCLQRLPAKRPSMIEVLKMLSGELQAPPLPFQFSPSPPCRVPYRSRLYSLSSEGAAIDFPIPT